jgi:hypothetical protein
MFKKPKLPKKPSHPSIERARKMATLLDTSFEVPFTRIKIGLDPLLGMLPVGGDAISALMAAYIVWVAIELGLPQPVIYRLAANVILDSLIGLVPVVGDVADAFWKSNQRNLKILEEAYEKHGIGPAYNLGWPLTKETFTQPENVVVDIQSEPVGK